VFICAGQVVSLDRPHLRFTVNRPLAIEQKQLWTHALGEHAARLNGALDAIVTQFRVSTEVMAHAAEALRAQPAAACDVERQVWHACRDSIRHRLDDLAQRVEPVATWDDLVLPDAQLATLRQVVAHVGHRLKVFEEWGFAGKSARGLGISVLFTGESGTGKTMAAEVLANALHLDLYRIDLASMVSKYIGETEKNLRRVFDAAEDSGTILLFDEADALFGKRSEIKDSHDRYANIEVSYLLQRMEAYRGLAILTTNLKGALDVAFQRRLRFIVRFPFPDQALRERIWRGSFPSLTPLDRIDHRKLAQLNVAGGHIRNIAVNAAFIAAEAGLPLGMNHLLQAARSEGVKRERPFSDAEMRGWA
jgi:SpoVK/Ycf46/Vps4 family AAA+-type ATPase